MHIVSVQMHSALCSVVVQWDASDESKVTERSIKDQSCSDPSYRISPAAGTPSLTGTRSDNST